MKTIEKMIVDTVKQEGTPVNEKQVGKTEKVTSPVNERQVGKTEIERTEKAEIEFTNVAEDKTNAIKAIIQPGAKGVTNFQMIPALKREVDAGNVENVKLLRSTYPETFKSTMSYISKERSNKIAIMFGEPEPFQLRPKKTEEQKQAEAEQKAAAKVERDKNKAIEKAKKDAEKIESKKAALALKNAAVKSPVVKKEKVEKVEKKEQVAIAATL